MNVEHALYMESELCGLMAELLTRTVGQVINTQVDRVKATLPESSVRFQNVVTQFDSLLHSLEENYRLKIMARILGDISVWIEHIWHFSASSLRVCHGESNSSEVVVTACRAALQESWYTGTCSPRFSCTNFSDSGKSTFSRPVIYISPVAPSHLRRWLSLNLCCSDLLITVLPAEEKCPLPSISVPYFEKIIQNDIRLGRQPLLLVAYAGSTLTGGFDCLPKLARICQRHKMWLHVEGLSFLHLALLASPPTKPGWATSINSINLELSLCLGLPRSLNVLLMQSSLPESILFYLNVFPLSGASAVTTATLDEELEGEQANGGALSTPVPANETQAASIAATRQLLPATALSEALFAWFALRTQEGSHSSRLQRAIRLVMHARKKMQTLLALEIFPSNQPVIDEQVGEELGREDYFVKMLYENSAHCPIILFRYLLSVDQEAQPQSQKSPVLRVIPVSERMVEKTRFFSEPSASSGEKLKPNLSKSTDLRFLNSLNQWLASALQFEHPNFSIKTHYLPNGTLVLRLSLLESVNLMTITEQDIDSLIENINLNCTIIEATWREKPAFASLVNSTPGLYFYNLPDWAGLGAAFYVPHTYRCLLPDASADASIDEYQTSLLNALLRLPSKAAHHICDLNRELISRLRNHDYAFSSTRVTFSEDLEEDLREKTLQLAGGAAPVSPIRTARLYCLRFGLITPGTDTTEMVQLVLRLANTVEEDSNYVNSLSEVVKRGIEEATAHMQEERSKLIREQGVLRQVPYLDRLINWWSPPANTQIHGQMLNLSIGELVPTDNVLPLAGASPAQRQQNRQQIIDQSTEKAETKSAKTSTVSSPSIWDWLNPFGVAAGDGKSPPVTPDPTNAVEKGTIDNAVASSPSS